jgi:hypothetical protein
MVREAAERLIPAAKGGMPSPATTLDRLVESFARVDVQGSHAATPIKAQKQMVGR